MEESSAPGLQYTHALPDRGIMLLIFTGRVIAVLPDGRQRFAAADEVLRMRKERSQMSAETR